jgi:hypothetical protein
MSLELFYCNVYLSHRQDLLRCILEKIELERNGEAIDTDIMDQAKQVRLVYLHILSAVMDGSFSFFIPHQFLLSMGFAAAIHSSYCEEMIPSMQKHAVVFSHFGYTATYAADFESQLLEVRTRTCSGFSS